MAESRAATRQDFRGDVPREYFFRDFKGINTQAHRSAIEDSEFSWLENIMPVGRGNCRTVPAQSSTLATIGATPQQSWHVNINVTEVAITACTDGSVYQTLLTTPFTSTQIAPAATLSASGAWAAQWKNERVLIIDPAKGYFSWDGTIFLANGNWAFIDFTNGGYVGGTGYVVGNQINLTLGTGAGATATVTSIGAGGSITGASILAKGTGYTANYLATVTAITGVGINAKLYVQVMAGPTAGTSIAVFQGRVWTANNRIVTFSAPGSYNDFTVASTGGQFTMVDPTLEDTIQALLSANNYLYIVGKTSFDVISDVRVVSNVTQFTRVNVQASIGTALPGTVFPYYRDILYFSGTGVYALRGSTPVKLSDALDGIIPLIDFTKPVTGGTVSIFNILCAAFCFTYNDPVLGARQLIAVYFTNKWFFSSQGAVNTVVSGNIGTVQTMFGFIGTAMVQLWQNTTASIAQTFQPKLWDFGNSIKGKQLGRIGLYVNLNSGVSASITGSLDNELGSKTLTLSGNRVLQFIGAGGLPLNFVGAGPIVWTVGGLVAMFSDATQYGAFLGFTFTSSTPAMQWILLEFDYFNREAWAGNK
jgi:hypothetical protein